MTRYKSQLDCVLCVMESIGVSAESYGTWIHYFSIFADQEGWVTKPSPEQVKDSLTRLIDRIEDQEETDEDTEFISAVIGMSVFLQQALAAAAGVVMEKQRMIDLLRSRSVNEVN